MNHLHRTYGPNLSDTFSGDVPHSILRSPTDTLQALNEAFDEAKIRNNTQSTKNKLRKFKNGDFNVRFNASFLEIRQDLRRLFTMDKKGATDYVVYDIPNGRMAFRLADHNANGNNFEQDEADSNISVYVAIREFDVPVSEVPFIEYRIEEETFNTKRKAVINAIINAVDHALEEGVFTMPEELAKRMEYPLKDSNHTQNYSDTNPDKPKTANGGKSQSKIDDSRHYDRGVYRRLLTEMLGFL